MREATVETCFAPASATVGITLMAHLMSVPSGPGTPACASSHHIVRQVCQLSVLRTGDGSGGSPQPITDFDPPLLLLTGCWAHVLRDAIRAGVQALPPPPTPSPL